eukprot:TRINITY_DN10350_c0_g1_i1.p1 TRINITY_DN10350_c0_g1~~TRINITY_DN10350_c0_g1_i1.p1  ORF type:complete len:414 (+),score=104.57 TRINITY_DN10350_c0_g1_i1:119-1360(+)
MSAAGRECSLQGRDLRALDDSRRVYHTQLKCAKEEQKKVREGSWEQDMWAYSERKKEDLLRKEKTMRRQAEWDTVCTREKTRQKENAEEFRTVMNDLRREWREERDREREMEFQRKLEWDSLINKERVRIRAKLQEFKDDTERERQRWVTEDIEWEKEKADFLETWNADRSREVARFARLCDNPASPPKEAIQTEPPPKQSLLTPEELSHAVKLTLKVSQKASENPSLHALLWEYLLRHLPSTSFADYVASNTTEEGDLMSPETEPPADIGQHYTTVAYEHDLTGAKLDTILLETWKVCNKQIDVSRLRRKKDALSAARATATHNWPPSFVMYFTTSFQSLTDGDTEGPTPVISVGSTAFDDLMSLIGYTDLTVEDKNLLREVWGTDVAAEDVLVWLSMADEGHRRAVLQAAP